MLSSKEKNPECSTCFKGRIVHKNNINILDLRAKAAFICLHFHMNKMSVMAALFLTIGCQINLIEEKDPGFFSPKSRSHSVWTAWLLVQETICSHAMCCTSHILSSTDYAMQLPRNLKNSKIVIVLRKLTFPFTILGA